MQTRARTRTLWLIHGTGMYWSDFYIAADSNAEATGKAKDILAGVGRDGKRTYGTADMEIMSVTEAGICYGV